MRFRDILEAGNINVQFRQLKGNEIDAACGQLRRKSVEIQQIGD
jgi:23S rRNA (adenine2503-C2)-methyltransferase